MTENEIKQDEINEPQKETNADTANTEEKNIDEKALLEEKIKVLTADNESLKDSYIRVHAEMENLRKRSQQEIEKNSRFAISIFAKDLLKVADNLERAVTAVTEEMKSSNEQVKNLSLGVEMTIREMANVFERHGIKRVETLGKPFDPNFHQAVQEIEDLTVMSGSVLQELQAGYTINGRILREAMVVVAKGGKKPEDLEKPNGSKVDTSA